VDIGFLVDAEVARLAAFNAADIELEHSGKLRPEGLADAVVVKVKHWDLVAIAHYALELLIDLDAQQHRVYVKASTSAGA
jgi:hypothetical protein